MMNEIPSDVLVIRYTDLALDAAYRLCLLRAIGTLLGKPVGFYTPAVLELFPDDWLCLQAWLEQDNASSFWHAESQGVLVIRACEKHVLVGTGQLLVDLKEIPQSEAITRLPSLDVVWMAAQRYVIGKVARPRS
jgi:hypothetical protein